MYLTYTGSTNRRTEFLKGLANAADSINASGTYAYTYIHNTSITRKTKTCKQILLRINALIHYMYSHMHSYTTNVF
jgi:hypothetical protein